MKLHRSFRSIVLAAIIMVTAGTLGYAQDYVFDDDPYYDPYYAPYFDSYYYDPYWNNDLRVEGNKIRGQASGMSVDY